MTKVYESIIAASTERSLTDQIRMWKQIADTSRDRRKIEFAEKRMVHYANALKILEVVR